MVFFCVMSITVVQLHNVYTFQDLDPTKAQFEPTKRSRHRSLPLQLDIANLKSQLKSPPGKQTPKSLKSPQSAVLQFQLFSEPATPTTTDPITLFGLTVQIRFNDNTIIISPGDFKAEDNNKVFPDQLEDQNHLDLEKNSEKQEALKRETAAIIRGTIAKSLITILEKIEHDQSHTIEPEKLSKIENYCTQVYEQKIDLMQKYVANRS